MSDVKSLRLRFTLLSLITALGNAYRWRNQILIDFNVEAYRLLAKYARIILEFGALHKN